jgi:hypothetical protein
MMHVLLSVKPDCMLFKFLHAHLNYLENNLLKPFPSHYIKSSSALSVFGQSLPLCCPLFYDSLTFFYIIKNLR